MRFFLVYNVAVLLGTLAAWLGLCRAAQVSRTGCWVGFVGLFVNFALLKLNTYYPVNYDPTAVLVGTSALLFYCRGSLPGLVFTSLAGLLVWPTTIYYHSLLLLLPWGTSLPPGGPQAAARNRTMAAGVAAIVVGGCLWVYFGLGLRPRANLGPLILPALPVSLACVAAWLYRGLSPLLADSDLLSRAGARALWGRIDRRGAVTVLILGASHFALTHALAARGPARYDVARYAVQFAFGGTTRPAQFLIAHAVYFGPVILLLLPLWSRAAAAARRLGAGVVLAAAAAVVQTINCESRQLMNVLPLLVLLVALAIDRLSFPAFFLPRLAVVSWLSSKAWMPLNAWAERLGADMTRFPILQPIQSFPAQVYFMSFGPWTSHMTLLAQGLVVLAVGLWLYLGPLRAARGGDRPVAEVPPQPA